MRIFFRSCILFWMISMFVSRGTVAQFHLPRLISEPDLQEYTTRYLTLSDEQTAVVHRLYEDYKTKWAESFNDQSRDLESRWSAVFTTFEKYTGDDMGESFRELLAIMDRARSERKIANDLFFDDIEMILAAEQLQSMQRVRNVHERSGYRFAKQTGALRERDIDIVILTERLEMTPEERAALIPVMAEFETGYTATMRDAAEVDLRREHLIFQCIELARQQSLNPNDEDGQSTRRLYEGNRLSAEADRLGYGSQKRLVDANRRGLRLFIAALPAETATRLLDAYNARAYSEVIPDPVRADDVYEQAITIVRKTDADRVAAIEAMREAYEREHASCTRKMITAVFELSAVPFELAIKFKGAEYGDEYMDAIAASLAKARSELRDEGLEREKLNLAQPPKIRAMMLPEEIALLPSWRFEQAPPPRPWGKLADAETPETAKATRKNLTEQRRRGNAPASQPAETRPTQP